MAPATQFEVAQPPNDAVSRVVFAPDSSTRLLVSSWDKNVYLYEIDDGDAASATLVNQFEHPAPVLDVCFGGSDNEAFTVGLDKRVTKIDLETGEQTTMSEHTKPVRCVVYSPEHQILVSASWDSTLHFHNLADPGSRPAVYTLPGKPHAMSVSPTKVVVAMTARLVHIFDLPTIASQLNADAGGDEVVIETWQKRESSLKFLTRAVACMPNDAGYATSSIEGRVAVEWFEDSAESQARKYAFKCHRQANAEEDGGGDVVYPVNALVFHPVFGKTFASGGGDGTVALWDAEAKRRMKQYQNFGNSVASLAFSKNGKYMAAGVCPGFETGQEDYNGAGQTKVVIRELSETEAKGKGAK